ncbi:hypothetical protein CLTEP_03720 [Clostridium tepidiprofundi DSM 19306]|uniref:Uncharacterized protein n=1 Tax=Clostridium tepidiprofundi DSM 19306 TaxID=1121338 RepID=A0A151B7R3_9CLOT|nr:hypothetical protein [Clostridium tepidiprofundi]KYH35978.1 hypothetical protein CLTEP_03720 [Clostridium tepidiprofundi DSM 19306]
MDKNRNKTNLKISNEIKSAYDANMDSKSSKTGYKEKELMPARKNLKR